MSVLYGAAGVAHDLETTRLLLDRGATRTTASPVYHAVDADDTACLELLLERGAAVRDTNALGNAIDSPAKVRVLLERATCARPIRSCVTRCLHAASPRSPSC